MRTFVKFLHFATKIVVIFKPLRLLPTTRHKEAAKSTLQDEKNVLLYVAA